MQPILKDKNKELWTRMILEHRRFLLEKVFQEFPEVLKQKAKVQQLRARIY